MAAASVGARMDDPGLACWRRLALGHARPRSPSLWRPQSIRGCGRWYALDRSLGRTVPAIEANHRPEAALRDGAPLLGDPAAARSILVSLGPLDDCVFCRRASESPFSL